MMRTWWGIALLLMMHRLLCWLCVVHTKAGNMPCMIVSPTPYIARSHHTSHAPSLTDDSARQSAEATPAPSQAAATPTVMATKARSSFALERQSLDVNRATLKKFGGTHRFSLSDETPAAATGRCCCLGVCVGGVLGVYCGRSCVIMASAWLLYCVQCCFLVTLHHHHITPPHSDRRRRMHAMQHPTCHTHPLSPTGSPPPQHPSTPHHPGTPVGLS